MKPAHEWPDWDFLFIKPRDIEMDFCMCEVEENETWHEDYGYWKFTSTWEHDNETDLDLLIRNIVIKTSSSIIINREYN